MAADAGVIVAYGAASAPTGWQLCDGSFVSQATYGDLFAKIGHTFNGGTDPGDGTFKLPDLRGRFALGKAVSGTGSVLGGTGGQIDHTHTGPSHTHGVNQPADHTAHTVTQPSSHGTLTHSGGAVASHPSALDHSGAAISNHSISAEAGLHGTHAANATHTHDAHGSTANTNGQGAVQLYSAPATHAANTAHTHDAHSAHTGSSIDAHGITQASDHAADSHTVTGPDSHGTLTHSGTTVTLAHSHSGMATTAGGTGASGAGNPPFQAVAFIIANGTDDIPVGAITDHGGASAPTDHVLCNGASYDRTVETALFNVIGYTFGGSDPNFNVPDLRDRHPIGKAASGTGSTLGGTGGGGGGNVPTVVFACGAECAALAHWTGLTGPVSRSTSQHRTGAGSILVAAAGANAYAEYIATGSASWVWRFSLYLDGLPGADAVLAGVNDPSTFAYYLGFDVATGKLAVGRQSGWASRVLGPVISNQTWTTIDLKFTISGGTATIDWRVDGADQTQLSASESGTTWAWLDLGQASLLSGPGLTSFTAYYDDLVISGTPGDYPIGGGSVDAGDAWSPASGTLHSHTGPSHTHPVTQADPHGSHTIGQAASHGTLTHANAAITDHAALTHAGLSVAAHTVGQPTAHGAHASQGGHTHDAHTGGATGTAAATARTSGPSTHSSDGAHTHSDTHTHSGQAVSAHSVTAQPTQHAAQSHTVSQPASHGTLDHSSAGLDAHNAHTGGATSSDGTANTGTADAPYLVTNFVIRKAAGTHPIGSGLAIGHATPPSGTVAQDGASYARAGTYADLYAVIGTAFGSVDGDHFNVPDARGRIHRGKSATTALGDTGGGLGHTHTGPSHTHGVTQPSAHSAHTPTQPASHGTLDHSGLAITSGDHPALSHSGLTLSGHTIAQADTHPLHTSEGGHQHDTHTTANVATTTTRINRWSRATAHTADGAHQHDAHPAHSGFALTSTAHSVTSSGADHAARSHSGLSVTQPSSHGTLTHSGFAVDAHSAHSGFSTIADGTGNTGTSDPPFQAVNHVIRYAEPSAATTVTPPAATLTTSLYAPTVSVSAWGDWSDVYSNLASDDVTVTPDPATLSTTLFAPTVSTPVAVTPDSVSLTTSLYAPTVSTPVTVTPPALALTTSLFAPEVSTPVTVTPPTASLATELFAPSVSTPVLATPATLALTTSLYAPTVSTPVVVTPDPATLTATLYAPTVTASDHKVVTPPTAELRISPPSVTVTTLQDGRSAGQTGDLSIAAHGTLTSSSEFLTLDARRSTNQYYRLFVGDDQSNSFGFGYDHIVAVIARNDDGNESSTTLATVDLGVGNYPTEWQLRLEIWGDPTSVTVRSKVWPTGDTEPGWTTANDNYALIPRSDDTFANVATIDSATRLPSQNEIQQITVNATGGTWTLQYSDGPTHEFQWNASAGDVAAWLDGRLWFPGFDPAQVSVAKVGSVYTVEFIHEHALVNLPQMTADGSSLVGGLAPDVALGLVPGPVWYEILLPDPTVVAVGLQTLSPAPVVIAASLSSPTVSRTIGLAPAPVGAAATVPGPGVASAYPVAPATVASQVSLVGPSIGLALSLSPAPVATASSLPAPQLDHDRSLSPSTVQSAAVLPAPVLSLVRVVAPSPAAAQVPLPQPAISVGIVPAPVASASAMPLPFLDAALYAAPLPVHVHFGLPAPELGRSLGLTAAPVAYNSAVLGSVGPVYTVGPAPVSTASALPAPAIGLELVLAPTPVAVATAVPLPSASGTIALGPAPVAAASAVPGPGIAKGAIGIAPTPTAAGTALPGPSIGRALALSPATVGLAAQVTSPTVTAGWQVSPAPVAVPVALGSPTVANVYTVAPSPVAASTAATLPAFGRTLALTAGPVVATTLVPAASVTAGWYVAPVPVPASTAVPGPSVGRLSTLSPAPVATSSSVPAPSIGLVLGLAPSPASTGSSLPAPAVTATLSAGPVSVGTTTLPPTISLVLTLAPSPVAAHATPTAPVFDRPLALAPGAVSTTMAVAEPDFSAEWTVRPGPIHVAPSVAGVTLALPLALSCQPVGARTVLPAFTLAHPSPRGANSTAVVGHRRSTVVAVRSRPETVVTVGSRSGVVVEVRDE